MSPRGLSLVADGLLLRYWKVLRRLRPAFLSFTAKPNIYGSIAASALGIPIINNITDLGTSFLSGRILERVSLRPLQDRPSQVCHRLLPQHRRPGLIHQPRIGCASWGTGYSRVRHRLKPLCLCRSYRPRVAHVPVHWPVAGRQGHRGIRHGRRDGEAILARALRRRWGWFDHPKPPLATAWTTGQLRPARACQQRGRCAAVHHKCRLRRVTFLLRGSSSGTPGSVCNGAGGHRLWAVIGCNVRVVARSSKMELPATFARPDRRQRLPRQ